MAQRKVRVVFVSEEEANKPFRRHRITEKTAAKPYVREKPIIPPFQKAIQTYAKRRHFVCNPNEFYSWCLKKKINAGNLDQRGEPLWVVLFQQWEFRSKWGGVPSWVHRKSSSSRRAFANGGSLNLEARLKIL